MSKPDASDTEASWLRTPLTDADEIASRYDEWVPTYEHELVTQWRYDAPFVAGRRITELLADITTASVLDLGCGTGLVGQHLHRAGVRMIDGVDVSQASLVAALATGFYRNVMRHDFNGGALPFAAHCYDAAISVGVLSYALDPLAVIRDLCRVVVPRSAVVFTHRTDLWETQNLSVGLTKLRESGAQ